jgi:hypothetical protein
MAAGHGWDRFTVRAYRDPAAGDARRVVFELKGDPGARPAVVVLRAGGELLVRYEAPDPPIAGLDRDDFLRRAAEVVQALPGA